MKELIADFALLCVLAVSDPGPKALRAVEQSQLACQKYYASCLAQKKPNGGVSEGLAMIHCILEKP